MFFVYKFHKTYYNETDRVHFQNGQNIKYHFRYTAGYCWVYAKFLSRLVSCEKWLFEISIKLYVLRPLESEKMVFTKVSVCLPVGRILIRVARLGVIPLDLGDFWSFSGKFRGRNSLMGKFSGFFFIQGFFRGLFYFILKSLISSNHRNCLICNKPSDWLYFLGEYQRSISLVYCTHVSKIYCFEINY